MTTPKPISVLMLIQSFFPTIGGAEKQCHELSKALREKGLNVLVLTRKLKGLSSHDLYEGVSVRRLWTFGYGFFNSIHFFIDVLIFLFTHQKQFHVYHAHLGASHALAAAIMGRIQGKPVFIKVGGGNKVGEIYLSRKTVLGRLKLWLLARFKPTLIVVSRDQLTELKGFGLERLKVIHIPNGINIQHYQIPTPQKKQEVRQQLGWKGTIFLYVGRFSMDKMSSDVFERLTSAWLRFRKNHAEAFFYLLGQGSLREKFIEIVDKKGISSSMILGEAQKNIKPLYEGADVFVLPSKSEGLSNALLESMACGLPIVASRVPGIVDLVKDETQGYLFDSNSEEELLDAFNKVAGGKDTWAQMGEVSRKVAESYDLSLVASHYVQLYENSSLVN